MSKRQNKTLKVIKARHKIWQGVEEGKDDLHEDERLFIHMIHRFQTQVVGGGAPDQASAKATSQVKPQAANPTPHSAQLPSRTSPLSQQEAWKAQSLKELVAENDTDASTARTNGDDSDSDVDDAKPKAFPNMDLESRKRAPGSSDDSPSPKATKR